MSILRRGAVALVIGSIFSLWPGFTAQAQRGHSRLPVRPPARVAPCDSVPTLNRQVVAFVKSKLGQRVATGECWDLAAEALQLVGAKWDGAYVFGKEVNYRTACVQPGDVIQFEGVVITYQQDDALVEERMGHHTAIVYEVKAPGDFVIADQNSGQAGKKVALSGLKLANVKQGQLTIYRPVK